MAFDDAGEGPAVWHYADASRAHVVVDAAAYFEAVRTAMLNARHRIMLIGWDFDTRISLGRGRRKKGDSPNRLGDFILWLADRTPELDIRILKWNFGALKALTRGRTAVDVARWAMHERVKFKLDSAHPFGCSHHQKIVVIDDKMAVCGGIDMTNDRWDTRDHVDNDPRRKEPNGKLYPPWHDLTMIVEGDAAAALGALGRARWETAGGEPLEPCPSREGSPWPEFLNAEYSDVTVGISRTRAAYEEVGEVREIEALFLEQIARARRFIYAENQYFASRKVAEAIALRLAEPDPPEIIIVGPETANGWLEQKAMDGARATLIRSLSVKDHARRFHYYSPFTIGGEPIYVHAKLLIVDDEILRIGSANMNNRSLGLDSECDVFLDSSLPGNADIGATITNLRYGLIAEHCGLPVDEVAAQLDAGETMASVIESAQGNGRALRRLELPELSDADQAIADNQMLDPEHAEEMFEPFASAGLFSRSRILRKVRG